MLREEEEEEEPLPPMTQVTNEYMHWFKVIYQLI